MGSCIMDCDSCETRCVKESNMDPSKKDPTDTVFPGTVYEQNEQDKKDMFLIIQFKDKMEQYQKEAIAHFISSHFGHNVKVSKALVC